MSSITAQARVTEAATAPDSADEAMAGNGFQAYVLSKCKEGLPNCKFEPSSLWERLSEQLAGAASSIAHKSNESISIEAIKLRYETIRCCRPKKESMQIERNIEKLQTQIQIQIKKNTKEKEQHLTN